MYLTCSKLEAFLWQQLINSFFRKAFQVATPAPAGTLIIVVTNGTTIYWVCIQCLI